MWTWIRWVAKLVAYQGYLLATEALWVRIQTSQKYKLGDISKSVANTLMPNAHQKKKEKKIKGCGKQI
jgi:hypothetical protein